jgi:hypothetical protein
VDGFHGEKRKAPALAGPAKSNGGEMKDERNFHGNKAIWRDAPKDGERTVPRARASGRNVGEICNLATVGARWEARMLPIGFAGMDVENLASADLRHGAANSFAVLPNAKRLLS